MRKGSFLEVKAIFRIETELAIRGLRGSRVKFAL